MRSRCSGVVSRSTRAAGIGCTVALSIVRIFSMAAARCCGLAGRCSFAKASGGGTGGNASRNSAGAGQRRMVRASVTKAVRMRCASLRSSHSRPSAMASAHACAVPGRISAAGVRSNDRHDSFCSPVRISSNSHSFSDCIFHLLQRHDSSHLLAHLLRLHRPCSHLLPLP